MGATDPGMWKFHRKLVARAFYTEHLKQMVDDMGHVADTFVATLHGNATASAKAKGGEGGAKSAVDAPYVKEEEESS